MMAILDNWCWSYLYSVPYTPNQHTIWSSFSKGFVWNCSTVKLRLLHYQWGEPTSWSLMFQKKIIANQMIKYGISGVLPVRFLFCKAQLVHTNFLYPYQMLSFYEIKSFTRALRNTDHQLSVLKCPGKWVYFINQGQLFQIKYIKKG